MNDKLQKIAENIIPFIILGISIAVIIGLLFMFFYIAIWGVIIGGCLWLIALAKQYFFPTKSTPSSKGRVIEHDDKK